MSQTVLSIMDREDWDQCTDNIVIADSATKELIWVPRDLWCHGIKDRINRAFAKGGHPMLANCLSGFGFRVTSSVCLLPSAIAPVMEKIYVDVHVPEPLKFQYPAKFQYPLKREQWGTGGYRIVELNPPAEHLEGLRVHEWIGARKAIPESTVAGDLSRIDRQKQLVKTLLATNFNLWNLVDTKRVSFYLADYWGTFTQVKSNWTTRTFGEGRLVDVALDGKGVLVWRDDTRNRFDNRLDHLRE